MSGPDLHADEVAEPGSVRDTAYDSPCTGSYVIEQAASGGILHPCQMLIGQDHSAR